MERMRTKHAWSYFEHTLTTAVLAEQGKIACIDTATGLITKAGTSTTLRPIGYFETTITGDGTKKARIELFAEIRVHLFDNDGTNPVAASDLGKVCYLKTDTSVTISPTGASVAGRVWGVSADGVLVEMLGFYSAIS